MGKVIAVDGPAGSGKSTVARIVAERLGYIYVDTGAMFRAVALKAHRKGLLWTDEDSLNQIAAESDIQLAGLCPGPDGSLQSRVILDGEEVSDAIRTPLISEGSSAVAVWPGVRRALLLKQRGMAEYGPVVMDGRDIGTVVFPGADVKVFLTASPDERVQRRVEELNRRGVPVDVDKIRAEMAARDDNDSTRAAAPLQVAEDAVVIDTTGLPIGEVVRRVLELASAGGETRGEAEK